MTAFRGDFMGFTFKGHHSSEFGIMHVSDGSRYSENLLPSFSHKTIAVPGGDRTLYFGQDYSSGFLPIHIAFDEVTELKFREMKAWLGDKTPGEIIFDERPYKVWIGKIDQSPTINYLCFDEIVNGSTQRVYKGEMDINFICFQPYAKSKYKYLNDYPDEDYTNKSEWAAASGMSQSGDGFDSFDENYRAMVKNAGDIDTPFKLIFPFAVPSMDIVLNGYDGANVIHEIPAYKLGLNAFSLKQGDTSVSINSENCLIEGLDATGKKTGNIYNEYIRGGNFFKIPKGNYVITLAPYNVTFNMDETRIGLEYYYLYY